MRPAPPPRRASCAGSLGQNSCGDNFAAKNFGYAPQISTSTKKFGAGSCDFQASASSSGSSLASGSAATYAFNNKEEVLKRAFEDQFNRHKEDIRKQGNLIQLCQQEINQLKKMKEESETSNKESLSTTSFAENHIESGSIKGFENGSFAQYVASEDAKEGRGSNITVTFAGRCQISAWPLGTIISLCGA